MDIKNEVESPASPAEPESITQTMRHPEDGKLYENESEFPDRHEKPAAASTELKKEGA